MTYLDALAPCRDGNTVLPSARRSVESSRLTTKYQATIPKRVRELLSLGAGDRVAFRVVRGRVVLEKAPAHDPSYLEAMERVLRPEWGSRADDDAFADL